MGDDFGCRSFEKYFQVRKAADYNSYVKAHFGVTGHFNNSFISDNPNVLSRISNLMVFALGKQIERKLLLMPKLFVMVLDDDILKSLYDYVDDENLTQAIGCMLNFIMTEQECNIASYKEYLPAKCLCLDYPFILWIQAPCHDGFKNNQLRVRFNRSLEEISKLHTNVYSLVLKKVWDPQDMNLYSTDLSRFTNEGFRAYWEAVDKTIRYFDSVILQKAVLKKCEFGKNPRNVVQKEQDQRFRWQNLSFNRNYDVFRLY